MIKDSSDRNDDPCDDITDHNKLSDWIRYKKPVSN